MITCQCPAGDYLTTIPAESCAERFGQTQKIIFQRLIDSHGSRVGITNTDAVKINTWVDLKAATDDTKIVVTPYIEEPTDDGGDARTVGGGNASLNGIETVIGSNPVNFSCKLNNKAQSIVAAIKLLMCEAMANNLGVYLINENGMIEGIKETNTWYPMPIQKLFVGDKHHGGLEGNDYNDLQFAFVPGYSDNVDFITLDESALQL